MMCAINLKRHLESNTILEKAQAQFPNYGLVFTGNYQKVYYYYDSSYSFSKLSEIFLSSSSYENQKEK